MKKMFRRATCLALASLTALSLVACGDEPSGGGGGNGAQKNNPETQPLVLSTDALDGKFNPFYATSATDVTIAAQTQLSMLTLNEKGEIACGENEATVALDYKVTMYDTAEQGTGNVTTSGSKAKRTEYEFVIKNGIKYSDGNDLTIDDVLFNLYVYLDPLYLGSATIYSTKIQGLQQYRTQNPAASSDNNTNQKKGYYPIADMRIQYVLEKYCGVDNNSGYLSQDQDMIDADFALAKKLFKEEVESDWTTNFGSLESYENEYTFTEDWQVYYFNAGLVTIEYEMASNGTYQAMKDKNGKYITTLDKKDASDNDLGETYKAEMEAALTGLEKGSDEYFEAMRQKAIDTVYKSYVNEDTSLMDDDVLKYWATGDKLREEIASQLLDAYYEELKNSPDGMPVKNISGISTYHTTSFSGGKMGSKLDANGHDVLKIVIDNVDPKAIYNFSFAVAPMHYYGDGDNVVGGKYDDYYKKANRETNFGVAFGEKDFFDSVLQTPEKTGVPVGAGAYMACNEYDSGAVTKNTFWKHNVVYYKRNPYFETVGKEIENAKIKYLRYQVIGSAQLMNALAAGTVHFGTPNASAKNIEKLNDYTNKLNQKHYRTNGYGYVGINAKFVPDINIRRIIMKTMDLSKPELYYGNLSSKIYRSMSLTSLYYPALNDDGEPDMNGKPILTAYDGGKDKIGDLTYYGDLNDVDVTGIDDEDAAVAAIKTELTRCGYADRNGDGIFENSDGEKLDYTFTIAGGSSDHPAHAMFQASASILRRCGFDITVRTDPQALTKLSNGELQVWAAAWSSPIDPDMYQVYHKDSTATSTKNWGYDEIYKQSNINSGKYFQERQIIDEMSVKIDEGRETIVESKRFEIYTEALDLLMELAVELPVYQREDLFVYDKNLIDEKTLNQNPSTNSGLLDRIWEVNFL
ncbi:MAG: hypothetical protein E7355_00720 [Clostridiales bacterium]|nr:hypothetical protein [Clostridiales bacterium]